MGTSTDGVLSFGVAFEEDFEFPWGEQDIDDWWEDEMSFTPTKQPWDKDGAPSPNLTEADITLYFKEKREWGAANPLPVELVNYCSGDCPMYILAVPGTETRASRGSVEEIVPRNMVVDQEAIDKYLRFCNEYGIRLPIGRLRWLLSGYWG